MQFRQVDVYTKSEAIQVLVMRLSELGLNGFIIHDPADFEEFLENKEYNWDYVDDSLMGLKTVEPHITCYVQDNEQGAEMLSALGGTLDELKENDTDDFYGSLDVTIDCVREEDWANNWKQYYKPFTVGEKLIVKPSWEEVENTDGRKILEIDPASSFGTGQHHTTRLVMELLEKQIHEGDRMLDLGTGSGILSIAGLLLGAKQAVTDVIVSMSPYFSGFLKKNGKLIVSGIITERLDEVLSALKENNIKVESISEKEGWNAILCTCNP